MPTFGDNLRSLREKAGLSRPELSHKLGFGVHVIMTYEMEKVQPTLPRLCKIADYFGVTLDSLAGRDEMKPTDIRKVMNALIKIYQCVKRIEEKK